MKKLTKRQREMSREHFDRLNWDIGNITEGIQRRERSKKTWSDLPQLRVELAIAIHLRDQAIIICETEDDMNNIAENSWS